MLSLVQLQLRTRATGVSRKAVAMLKVERVLLALAMAWSLVHGLVPSARDEVWLAVLDVFWPLSMLGMFVIGIKVAVAGRWRGAARLWPLVAESWAVVCIPVMGIFGQGIGDVVGATHLLVGYATLGLVIAARPALVMPEPGARRPTLTPSPRPVTWRTTTVAGLEEAGHRRHAVLLGPRRSWPGPWWTR